MSRQLRRIEQLYQQLEQAKEDNRLHKIRIAMLEQQYDDLLKERFTDDEQRNQWESAWNLLVNEGNGLMSATEACGILMEHFKLVPNTQFTQRHEQEG